MSVSDRSIVIRDDGWDPSVIKDKVKEAVSIIFEKARKIKILILDGGQLTMFQIISA